MTELPVLVTVLPARTAKVTAVPRTGAVAGSTPMVFAPVIKAARVIATRNRRARFTVDV